MENRLNFRQLPLHFPKRLYSTQSTLVALPAFSFYIQFYTRLFRILNYVYLKIFHIAIPFYTYILLKYSPLIEIFCLLPRFLN